MSIKLPEQLLNKEFKFYRICKNSKIPQDSKWNTKNNYSYYVERIIYHKGNYGVVTGYGNLIVLDFDTKEYHDEIKDKLPRTFMVTTAGKRLPHYYYILDGEMFNKIPIDVDGKRVCDIQGKGVGVVGPNSIINGKYYDPNTTPISHITIQQLKDIFKGNFSPVKLKPKLDIKYEHKPGAERLALDCLKLCGVTITDKLMKCPFHAMSGKGNLSVLSSGKIYCFHEQKHWWPNEFLKEALNIDYTTSRLIVKMLGAINETS